MSKERILKEATFSPKAVSYHVVTPVVFLCIIIVGIPVAIILGPILHWYYTRYYARLRVILSARDLKVHRGILNRMEKTIPLEKITDLAVYDGPIMRHFGVKGIRVETAGQSSGAGALVTVIGIEDTDGFRDMVLNQRDRITERDDAPAATPAAAASPSMPAATADGELLNTMRETRDALHRIEDLMRKQS
jgi:putative membrane protein